MKLIKWGLILLIPLGILISLYYTGYIESLSSDWKIPVGLSMIVLSSIFVGIAINTISRLLWVRNQNETITRSYSVLFMLTYESNMLQGITINIVLVAFGMSYTVWISNTISIFIYIVLQWFAALLIMKLNSDVSCALKQWQIYSINDAFKRREELKSKMGKENVETSKE